MAERVVRHRGLRAKIMQHFEEHPGVVVWLHDLVEATGCKDPRPIQIAVQQLRSRDDYPVEIKINGQSWIYRPKGAEANGKRVFEELAITKAGELLIQDEAGKVYLAKEL